MCYLYLLQRPDGSGIGIFLNNMQSRVLLVLKQNILFVHFFNLSSRASSLGFTAHSNFTIGLGLSNDSKIYQRSSFHEVNNVKHFWKPFIFHPQYLLKATALYNQKSSHSHVKSSIVSLFHHLFTHFFLKLPKPNAENLSP